ncbi:MAG: diaminopimelate epimerase [Ignavibacteriales bacterium]|nr:diaminopimelate epimerase [Ignavibacteriales bacterium]
MIKYSFTKMNGAGNDFIMFDLDRADLPELTPQRIRNICDRRFGIGADGVITIRQAKDNEFLMIYYNADGSSGTLCGNGARCAVRFAYITGKFDKEHVVFHSNNLVYRADLTDGNNVRFWLQSVQSINMFQSVFVAQQEYVLHYADTGSPHVVLFLGNNAAAGQNPVLGNSLEDVPVHTLGRAIRYLPGFPGGVNVNFVEIINNQLHIRTYERGVEAETLACGTGSVASAIVSHNLGLISSPVTIVTRSNKKLHVGFEKSGNDFINVSLTGPADVNFSGEYEFN